MRGEHVVSVSGLRSGRRRARVGHRVRGPHPDPAGPFRAMLVLWAGGPARAPCSWPALCAQCVCVLAWAPQCPATSMWPSPSRDSAKVCPANVTEPAGVTKGAEAWAALAEDLHREGARQDLSLGPTPDADGALPPTRGPGADSPACQAKVPGTGQKPGSAEPRSLCQAAGSGPQTRATRPLPVSCFISLTCSSAHTCVSLAGRGAACLPGLPAGSFPWFPAPARSLPAAGKCSLAGSAASLKNDFLPSQKGLNIAQA